MKLFASFCFSFLFAIGAAAQSTPVGAKVGAPAKAESKPTSKEQARQKFVLDVVHSAIALPQPDPQDRLRVLTEAVNVVAPIDQKFAQQLAREGTAIESKLVAEGQRPAASMLAGGHVDCAAAANFVQALPPNEVVSAEQALIGAITTCPKQVNEAAKSKLEAGMQQGVVAGRPLLALMDSEGMNSPWSQRMFTQMFSSLPDDAESMAKEAPNYAAMFEQIGRQMDKDVAKTAGAKFLLWLAKLPDSPQRSVAINLTTTTLGEILGTAAYQELLRSDVALQQVANSAKPDAELPPPDENEPNVSVLQAMSNAGDRTQSLQGMPAARRAREAAASGFASGTAGDRKTADHYFDIAFASADEVWAARGDSGVDAPEVVQEVSEAAAQVDAVAALQRSQKLQDPSAEAISMLAVARVVAGQP
ncbi:MAG TPA: hypothetical protein VFB04_10680 [Terriglobales bacterium]|nr:hypothetical protein [Terriglobales bacterium]